MKSQLKTGFLFSFIPFLFFLALTAAEIREEDMLPADHSIFNLLCELCQDPEVFDSFTTLADHHFEIKNPPETIREESIMVAKHPDLKGYLIKKYANSKPKDLQLSNYLARVRGAQAIAAYIEEHQFKHLVVPKKWIFPLPEPFSDNHTHHPDYLLVVEELNLCPGGWWGGETLDYYAHMKEEVMEELCYILHDLSGCDAWPQNLPFTTSGKIAFIDTEHLGQSFGDFIFRILSFINPILTDKAIQLWIKLEEQRIVSPPN